MDLQVRPDSLRMDAAFMRFRPPDGQPIWHLNPAWTKSKMTPAQCLLFTSRGHGPCHRCSSSVVSFGLLYYNAPDLLQMHLTRWAKWPHSLSGKFDFIVVDDCSSLPNAATRVVARVYNQLDAVPPPPIRVLQILPPKRAWNIGGGRNLLMHSAKGCWVLMLDMDYSVPPSLARELLWAPHSSQRFSVFKFRRRRSPLRGNTTVHPAIALVRRELFWAAGGCDEDFVGHYGYTDPHFFYRLRLHTPAVAIRVNRSWPRLETLRDDATPQAVSAKAHNKKLFQKKKAGQISWSNWYLRFNWTVFRCSSPRKRCEQARKTL